MSHDVGAHEIGFVISMTADADFACDLTVLDFQVALTADADFLANLTFAEIQFKASMTADADFVQDLEVARKMIVSLDADLDAVSALSAERQLAVSLQADANFQDALQVFDAFFVSLTVDADFGEALTVVMDVAFVSNLTADANFTLNFSGDRFFSSALQADADLIQALDVERILASDLAADADLTMDLDVDRVILMTDFTAEANFQATATHVLAFASSMTATADFAMDLFTADHDGFVSDLLGITDQMEGGNALQLSGLSSNLDAPGHPQWQIEQLADGAFIRMLGQPGSIGGEVTTPGKAPVVSSTHDAEFVKSMRDDWFDNLYVLPPSVDAGLVATDQSVPFEIYSSFLDDNRSLDTFVNNVGAGTSLGGFPSLPETILPQDGFTFTLEISRLGPPTFDGTLDFGFDIQTILVPVEGQRVRLFAVEPDRRVNERLIFGTNVFRRLDETEQRRSNRKTPRQVFEYTYDLVGVDRQIFDSVIFDRQGQFFAVPVFMEPAFLTQDASIGDSVLNVDNTSFGDFTVGGLVTLWEDARTAEVFEIGAVTATTISLTTFVTQDHDRTVSRVYPIKIAAMGPLIRGEKFRRGFQRTKVTWRVRDNDADLSSTAAFGTFQGKVFLDEPNLVEDRLRESMERRMTLIDGKTGVFETIPESEVSRRVHPKTFLATTRQRLFEIRQLLHALKGRRTSFYIPTFYDEFTVTQDISILDDTITFDNFGYTQFVGGRAPRNAVQLVLKDGTKVPRLVVSQVELSVTEERIQVDSPWGVDATVEEIDRVEYISKVRMNSDEVRIQHDNARGQATITVPLIEVLE